MGRGRRFSFAPGLAGPKSGTRPAPQAAAEAAAAPDLEAGIAAIFASMREAGTDAGPRRAAGAPAVDDGVTFDLLGELDRIWRNNRAA